MSPRDLARETVTALDANRGRTLLTVLGIVIGIAAVIAMTSLIGGVRNTLVGQLGLDAARRVSMMYSYGLTEDDLTQIKREVPGYELVAGAMVTGGDAKAAESTVSMTMYGSQDDYLRANGIEVERGRMWTQEEYDQGAAVCLLTEDGMRQLFGDPQASPDGKSVTVNSVPYQVIGVVSTGGMTYGGGEGHTTSWLPLKTVETRMGMGYGMSDVVGFATEGTDIDDLMARTKEHIAEMKGVPADEVDENVYLYSMKEAIDAMDSYMSSFSLIMGAVAGVSLLVGGIGIMNMMLTNVTERIREIGLRRALGATRRDITTQFLAEAVAISVVGGVIGVAVGFGGAWALSAVASASGLLGSMMGGMGEGTAAMVPAVSPEAVAVACGICVVIGLVFGYGPARRAARLDPVEALRYQ